ncbi:hypothetical protein PCE1_002764 [Barthelona sp. PCE]
MEENLFEKGIKLEDFDKCHFNEYVDVPVNNTHRFDMILGYVTPWNGRGYDVAKNHAKRFTHISPCWFTLNSKYVLEGIKDVDRGWLRDLKKENNDLKVFPRIRLNVQDVNKALRNSKWQNKFRNVLKKFDGFVLDVGGHDVSTNVLSQFLNSIHQPVIIAGSYRALQPQKVREFQSMEFIVKFQVYMYDYAPPINAPIKWIEEMLHMYRDQGVAGKVLAGMNWYGYRKSVGDTQAIIGTSLLESIAEDKGHMSVKWAKTVAEHRIDQKFRDPFTHKRKITSYHYPTPFSILARLEVIKRYGSGVAIWELGQGLGCFPNLYFVDK